jgi:hypothetical protein
VVGVALHLVVGEVAVLLFHQEEVVAAVDRHRVAVVVAADRPQEAAAEAAGAAHLAQVGVGEVVGAEVHLQAVEVGGEVGEEVGALHQLWERPAGEGAGVGRRRVEAGEVAAGRLLELVVLLAPRPQRRRLPAQRLLGEIEGSDSSTHSC